MADVKIIALVDGRSIIAEVTYDQDGDLTTKNPTLLVPEKQEAGGGISLRFTPFILGYKRDGVAVIYRRSIVAVVEPEDNIVRDYQALFSRISVVDKIPPGIKRLH